MYLITKWFGTFIYNKKGVKNKILFPKNEDEIAKLLLKIDKNEILPEEKKITKGIKKIIVSEKRLQKIGEYIPSDPFFKKFDIKPEDFDFSEDLLHKATLIVTKNRVEERLASEDLQIIQMVNALNDLIQTSNLLSERLDSWSVIPTSKEKMQPLKNAFFAVNNEIKSLEKQIDIDMQKIAPNISKMTGPLIGARLISLAGGLVRLAILPASTIQILGAEKALFRFKKEGGKPPKHGVIFQHSYINKSPREIRGKIARVFAAKIAIAAKADAFTKRDISKDLIKDIDERIKEIKNLNKYT
jgi:nucleolar protein 56